MAAVIFTGTNTVKLFIVEFAELFTEFGVFPYPFIKGLFDQLMLFR